MDTTWVDIVIRFISTLGFPIVVAVWLLWRDWKLTTKFIETLETLKDAVEDLCQKLDSN